MNINKKKGCMNWKEKYILSLKEEFSIKEIMLLRECGAPKARQLREEALNYCISHHISFNANQKIPAEALFAITGKNIDFYKQKMVAESLVEQLPLQQYA
ncbi:hypothetical protein B5E87_11240 [Massilimicrobiota sp. An142]|uniref:hypothetical protein n=1 Tax=unclassified Massilimicrobiota TaxID=2619866 RepID=UPI000B387B3E|nr:MULTISPECIES: hypothetical protein [unclassified Massilimicrobiota]OUN37701.1 hypothetical protein B5G32_02720 [Massilimicrobiota sp. An80]OUQ12067.1 hypothetical protein B5E87_11240 [Massilimicrobiota sp. An142]OUQ75215.1 hypothetical protein B5E48_10975 [Massilimicrobiota sp. An105]